MRARPLHEVPRAIGAGSISRRRFARAAAGIGASVAAIGHFARAGGRAQVTPAPPVVTQPCAAVGCPWTDKDLYVQCIDDEVRLPWDEVKAEFQAATGAELFILADPSGEAFPKLVYDAISGANAFDAAMIGMSWLGELVAGGMVRPYDDFYADAGGRFPRFDADDELPGVRALRMYDGRRYVVPYDCDCQVLSYRRDLLSDPAHGQAFKAEYGYDLAVPRTWDELRDIARYFTGKPLGGDAPTGHGLAMPLAVGGQGVHDFVSLSAPYVIGPENPTLYWFDPETMDPLVASEGHRRALERYLELAAFGPAETVNWKLAAAREYFLRGNAVFTWSGDVVGLAVERNAVVKGKVGTAPLPGTTAYVDPTSGREYATETPNVVGNTTGASWGGVIMASSDLPDSAYYFLALTATEPKQRFYAARAGDGVDPGRFSQIPPSVLPEGTGSVDIYVAQGWVAADAEEYLKARLATFQNPNQLPLLRIPGAFTCWEALDARLHAAVAGQLSPADALRTLAEDFRAINEGFGVQAQADAYKKSLGL